MHNEILFERVMERLLNEELVSIKRYRGAEEAYDVDFDEAGNVIGGAPAQIDGPVADPAAGRFAKYKELRAAYPKTFSHFFGGVPKAELINFLNSTSKFLQEPTSPGRMAEIFRSPMWRETLQWPKPSDVGRGELQLRLAFRALDARGGADLQTEIGSFSVKYVGGGGDAVRSGERSPEVRNAIVDFKRALLSGRRVKLLSVKAQDVEREIEASLAKAATEVDERGRRAVDQAAVDAFFTNLRIALAKLKLAVATEHGVSGIIFVSDDAGKYLPANRAPNSLRVKSISSESRINFFGPDAMGGPGVTTFESVIERKRAAWTGLSL